MSRLTPSERDKLTKLMGELNERNCNSSINLTNSTHSTANSITHSSIHSSSSICSNTYIDSLSPIMYNRGGSDTSSDVDRDGDTNVIGDNSNQKYDDNSTLLNALRNSESAEMTYSSSVFPSPDAIWEFPSTVEISYQPSKAERMAHAIFYSVWSDDITWLWIALFLLTTYRF
jgi:hypothetical protein